MHAGGENTTAAVRKSVLTGYQLGWLRPENKFHVRASTTMLTTNARATAHCDVIHLQAYKPLHEALVNGKFSVRYRLSTIGLCVVENR